MLHVRRVSKQKTRGASPVAAARVLRRGWLLHIVSVHPWLPHIASLEQNSPTATWHEALAHAQCLPYLRAPFVAAEAASRAAPGEAELCSRALCFISLPVSTGEMVSAARDRAAPAGAVPADSIAAW